MMPTIQVSNDLGILPVMSKSTNPFSLKYLSFAWIKCEKHVYFLWLSLIESGVLWLILED